MKSKVWLRYIYAAAIASVLALGTAAQSRSNQIYRPCAASIIPASVRVTLAGAITLTPCSGQTVTVNGIASGNWIVGPAAATDNAVVRYDATTGKLAQDSLATVSDTGTVNIPIDQSFTVSGSLIGTVTSGNAVIFGGSNFITDLKAGTAGIMRFFVGTTVVAGANGTTGTFHTNTGTTVASAAAIVPTGNIFHVSGVAAITSITSTGVTTGTCITMIFDSTATLTDGSNIKAAGNLVATADDTWSGCYDGTNWYETARAIN